MKVKRHAAANSTASTQTPPSHLHPISLALYNTIFHIPPFHFFARFALKVGSSPSSFRFPTITPEVPKGSIFGTGCLNVRPRGVPAASRGPLFSLSKSRLFLNASRFFWHSLLC